MKYYFTILLFYLSIISACGQKLAQDELDSLFNFIETNELGMGSISLYQDGKEVYARAIGYADFDNKITSDIHTKFRIGSISKTFTATLVLQQIEQAKLNLDTKLEAFYPEIPNAKNITIAHLLRHRSGLFNFTNDPEYRNWMDQKKTKEELLKIFKSQKIEFEAGEKFAYSNTNYVLLSFILEDVTSDSYAHILQEYITTPLSLKHTYLGSKIDTDKGEAQSYFKVEDWQLATETDMSIPLGAGGIVSTPSDINLFLNTLFSTEKLLSKSSVAQMKTMQEGYGMGLTQIPFYEKVSYGHSGNIDEFYAMSSYFPDEKFSIAYTSNGIGMAINDIMIDVLSIYFGKEYQLPEIRPVISLDPNTLDQYLGTYSSPDFPLKITMRKENSRLVGQATGQSSFPLEAIDEHLFQFQPAGIVLEFNLEDDILVLRQAGNEHTLKKER